MKWVESAVVKPHRCAVIPFIGTHDDLGFIDTGSEMDGFDNHVYVSVRAVHEMARLLGLPSRDEYNQLVLEANQTARQLEQTTADLREARRHLDAIDALESADFRTRRRVGRPRKDTAAV